MALTCRFVVPWIRVIGPAAVAVIELRLVRVETLEAHAPQRRALRVADAVTVSEGRAAPRGRAPDSARACRCSAASCVSSMPGASLAWRSWNEGFASPLYRRQCPRCAQGA